MRVCQGPILLMTFSLMAVAKDEALEWLLFPWAQANGWPGVGAPLLVAERAGKWEGSTEQMKERNEVKD